MYFRLFAIYATGFISGSWMSGIYASKSEFKRSNQVMQCMNENFERVIAVKK